jgi:hypothetical protein
MTDRRYRDDEVRKIFGLATTQKVSKPSVSSTVNGLTLAEMQSIGLDVGLDPDAVAQAAAAFESIQQPLRKSWGIPIEVVRTVSLPRALTEHEWQQLVAELRTTFRATGRITAHGALKEWSNGNLRVLLEPTAEGYRVRMGTVKGDAAGLNALGAGGIVASAGIFASLAFWGVPTTFADAALYLAPIILGGGGIGALVSNRSRLPRWARLRAEQMDHIATRIRSIMGVKSDAVDSDISRSSP